MREQDPSTGRTSPDVSDGPVAGLRLPRWLRHPLVATPLALLAAFGLFVAGREAGRALYVAFEGDTTATITSVVVLVVAVVAVIGLGALADRWLASRRQRRGGADPN